MFTKELYTYRFQKLLLLVFFWYIITIFVIGVKTSLQLPSFHKIPDWIIHFRKGLNSQVFHEMPDYMLCSYHMYIANNQNVYRNINTALKTYQLLKTTAGNENKLQKSKWAIEKLQRRPTAYHYCITALTAQGILFIIYQ